MSNRGFELVIKCTLPVQVGVDDNQLPIIKNKETYLHLDTIAERDITTSAKIASQPIFNGNTLSDHMYRDPDNYSISGTFSLYGNPENSNDPYAYVEGTSPNGDRLENIQKTFEYIKDNAILCDLMTFVNGNEGSSRFKIRKSMALESITWKEKESSMDYSFSFKEIISLNYDLSNIDISISEENKASLASPDSQNLGDILFSKSITTNSPLTFWDSIIINCLCQSQTYINKSTVVVSTLYAEQSTKDNEIYYPIQDKVYSAIITEIAKNNPTYLDEYIKATIKRYEAQVAGNIGVSAGAGVAIGTMAGFSAAMIAINAGAVATSLGAVSTGAAVGSSAGPIGIVVGIVIGLGILAGGIIVTATKNEKKRFKIIDGLNNWMEQAADKKVWMQRAQKYNINLPINFNDNSYKIDDDIKSQILLAHSKDTTKINYSELKRLKTFLNECNVGLNKVANNCRFYQLPDMSNTNKVECKLNFGGNYYKFTFTKKFADEILQYRDKNGNTIGRLFKMQKLEVAIQIYNNLNQWENLDGSNGIIVNAYDRTIVNQSLEEVSSDTSVFIDKTGTYEVYLYNGSLEPELVRLQAENSIKDWSDKTNNYLDSLMLSCYNVISNNSNVNNCTLIVSYGSFENVKNDLKETISKYVSTLEV